MSPSFCPNFKLKELITIPLAGRRRQNIALTLDIEAPPILKNFGGGGVVVGATRQVFVGISVGEDDAQRARCLVAIAGRLQLWTNDSCGVINYFICIFFNFIIGTVAL